MEAGLEPWFFQRTSSPRRLLSPGSDQPLIIAGCGDLQRTEFVSPAVQHRSDRSRSIARLLASAWPNTVLPAMSFNRRIFYSRFFQRTPLRMKNGRKSSKSFKEGSDFLRTIAPYQLVISSDANFRGSCPSGIPLSI